MLRLEIHIRGKHVLKILVLPLSIKPVEKQTLRRSERVKSYAIPLRQIGVLEFLECLLSRSRS